MSTIVDFSKIPPGWYLDTLMFEPDRELWLCELQWRKGGGRATSGVGESPLQAFEDACTGAANAPKSGRYSPKLDWTPFNVA